MPHRESRFHRATLNRRPGERGEPAAFVPQPPPPPIADPAALLAALTTEHFTLQTARNATISDSTGRSALYLSTVSSAVVALAFIGQVSRVGAPFRVFALVLLPALFVLGLLTYARLIESAIEGRDACLGAMPGPTPMHEQDCDEDHADGRTEGRGDGQPDAGEDRDGEQAHERAADEAGDGGDHRGRVREQVPAARVGDPRARGARRSRLCGGRGRRSDRRCPGAGRRRGRRCARRPRAARRAASCSQERRAVRARADHAGSPSGS